MPAALLDKLMALYPDLGISQGYGMTESSAVLTFLTAHDHSQGGARLRSAGRPVMGVTLSDPGRRRQRGRQRGRSGEVCARGGNFMREYWNKPEATAEVFAGGWYHTGDAGYLDDEGYLFLVDRVKDMIVTGGENVYSAEVESALGTHDAVAQVAVIGIPHETWGEQVHAIVVLDEGAEVTVEELQAFASESDRRLQGAQVRRLPGRALAALRRHEGPQARAAGPVLGRSGNERLTDTSGIDAVGAAAPTGRQAR